MMRHTMNLCLLVLMLLNARQGYSKELSVLFDVDTPRVVFDSTSSTFTAKEAEALDQWISDARTTKRIIVMAIATRDHAIDALKVSKAKADSSLKECRLRDAMTNDANQEIGDANAKLLKKVQRRTPWAWLGKGALATVVVYVIVTISHSIASL